MKISTHLILLASMMLLLAFTYTVKHERNNLDRLGLTYHSNIESLPNGSYLAEVQAEPIAGQKNDAIAYAATHAYDYCKTKKKKLRIIRMEIDSNFTASRVARLIFKCK